ncbi:MAG: hypothetical protein M3069_10725 [Chloroflexota bacterium]|nr:hypothetical protein [Chloroflexota bacterium]
MPILSYLEHTPEVGEDVRLPEDAYLVGKVHVAGPAHFGPSAVLRGDQNRIVVGPRFHIGARSTIHVELLADTQLGSDVWLGDDVVVHACVLGDGVRVEAGGLVLSTSSVGRGSIVAAAALVSEDAQFPENSYISGTPGRRVRATTAEEREETRLRVIEALGATGRDTRD